MNLDPACWSWPLAPWAEFHDGRCAACGRRGELLDDHDHIDGLRRGYLCPSCNLLEGRSDHETLVRYRRRPPSVILDMRMPYRARTDPDGFLLTYRRGYERHYVDYRAHIQLPEAEKDGWIADRLAQVGPDLRSVAIPESAEVRSAATRKAYELDWSAFTAWCAATGQDSLPARLTTVTGYLEYMHSSGAAPASLRRYLSSIAHYHREAGVESPTRDPFVLGTRRRIEDSRGHEPHRMRALSPDDLDNIISGIDRTSLAGKRDALALLLGVATGCGRDDLAGLLLQDVEPDANGLRVRVADGRWVRVPAYSEAVEAYRDWLHALPDRFPEAPLLRNVRNGVMGGAVTGAAIHAIVKRRGAEVGLTGVGAYSLRLSSLGANLAASA